MNLWGLDAIKTKGESVGIVLELVGARPVKEGTGRVVRYELRPLAELGRPRVDVLCNMSGIFRDSFANVVALIDDLFQRAAAAEGESPEDNYVKKHVEEMGALGVDNAAARLFSNPPGDYGSMVGRCKLDPSLKAPCFRSLNPESAFIAFNLNLVSELAPLQHGERARGDGGVGGRPRARRHVGGAQRVFLRPWRRAR